MFMTWLGLEVGSWAEWVGAIFSGVALVLVTNETRKNIKHDKEMFIINKDFDNLMLIETKIKSFKDGLRELIEIYTNEANSFEFRKQSFEIRELASDISSVVDFISSSELIEGVKETRYHLNIIDIELQKMSSNSLNETDIERSIFNTDKNILDIKTQINLMKMKIKDKNLNPNT